MRERGGDGRELAVRLPREVARQVACMIERPMPIQSGAMQRRDPESARRKWRHSYDQVGVPCAKTTSAEKWLGRMNRRPVVSDAGTTIYVTNG